MATEESAGIHCFANSANGFQGILKQRWNDFLVNEVDCQGNIIRLTSLEPPKPDPDNGTESQPLLSEDFGKTKKGETISAVDLSEKISNAVLEFSKVSKTVDVEIFKNYLNKIAFNSSEEIDPLILTPSANKTYRTNLHNFFKTFLPAFITDTVDSPNGPPERCVRVRCISKTKFKDRREDKWSGGRGKTGKRGERGGRGWGSEDAEKEIKRKREEVDGDGDGYTNVEGNEKDAKRLCTTSTTQPFDKRGSSSKIKEKKYLLFYLYKENIETQHAISVISRILNIKNKSFGFAGTKDKRAVTVQRVTVFCQKAEKLSALNKRLFNMKLGNFKYVDEPISLGSLGGNHFVVTLRNVISENDEVVKLSCEELMKSGFINYFGLQRFGNNSISTYSIGICLLKGEWTNAIDLILKPREEETGVAAEARKIWAEKKDAESAHKLMPRHLIAECALLNNLKNESGNHVQSLASIPRPLRMMYIHSWQSYVWNNATSHRIKTYGSSHVVIGDIVLVQSSKTVDNDKSENVTSNELNDLSEKENDINEIASLTSVENEISPDFNVKIVDEDDIVHERYSIEDVVLPLPGFAVIYPKHSTSEIYKSIAEKNGVSLHSSPHNVKEYSILHLKGAYRKIIIKPKNYEWKLVNYEDESIGLAQTDLEKLCSPLSKPASKLELDSKDNNNTNADVDTTDESRIVSGRASSQINSESVTDPTVTPEADLSKIKNGILNTDSLVDEKTNSRGESREGIEKGEVEDEKVEEVEGKKTKLALLLSFTLPPSSYATMVIRELLKSSSAVAYHKSLCETKRIEG